MSFCLNNNIKCKVIRKSAQKERDEACLHSLIEILIDVPCLDEKDLTIYTEVIRIFLTLHETHFDNKLLQLLLSKVEYLRDQYVNCLISTI